MRRGGCWWARRMVARAHTRLVMSDGAHETLRHRGHDWIRVRFRRPFDIHAALSRSAIWSGRYTRLLTSGAPCRPASVKRSEDSGRWQIQQNSFPALRWEARRIQMAPGGAIPGWLHRT
jgi:allantoicase